MATKKDDKKKLTKKPATKPVAKNPVAKKSTTKTASKPVAKKPEVKKKIEIEAKKIEKIVTTNSVIAKPTTQKYIEIKEPSYDESIIDLDFDNDPIVADEDEEVLFEAKKKEISHSGYTKLLEELKELEDVSVPSVNERIKEAREFGDLSENAEYKSALNEKQMLETRISELKEIVANSIVVDGSKKGNTVQYGSTVTLHIQERNETFVVTIIGSAEITFEQDMKHISFDSPIGLAIEGKKAGDVCKVRAERGRFDVKIVKIA